MCLGHQCPLLHWGVSLGVYWTCRDHNKYISPLASFSVLPLDIDMSNRVAWVQSEVYSLVNYSEKGERKNPEHKVPLSLLTRVNLFWITPSIYPLSSCQFGWLEWLVSPDHQVNQGLLIDPYYELTEHARKHQLKPSCSIHYQPTVFCIEWHNWRSLFQGLSERLKWYILAQTSAIPIS